MLRCSASVGNSPLAQSSMVRRNDVSISRRSADTSMPSRSRPAAATSRRGRVLQGMTVEVLDGSASTCPLARTARWHAGATTTLVSPATVMTPNAARPRVVPWWPPVTSATSTPTAISTLRLHPGRARCGGRPGKDRLRPGRPSADHHPETPAAPQRAELACLCRAGIGLPGWAHGDAQACCISVTGADPAHCSGDDVRSEKPVWRQLLQQSGTPPE